MLYKKKLIISTKINKFSIYLSGNSNLDFWCRKNKVRSITFSRLTAEDESRLEEEYRNLPGTAYIFPISILWSGYKSIESTIRKLVYISDYVV